MAPLSSFEIGTSSSTTNVESLTTPLQPPRSTFTEFSQDIELGDGGVRGGGWIAATWTWDYMTQAQYTQLLTFCVGKSDTTTWIVTKTDHETFVKYACVMVRPSTVERRDGKVMNVTIDFRSLVAA
jgi:hypothetical protein